MDQPVDYSEALYTRIKTKHTKAYHLPIEGLREFVQSQWNFTINSTGDFINFLKSSHWSVVFRAIPAEIQEKFKEVIFWIYYVRFRMLTFYYFF